MSRKFLIAFVGQVPLGPVFKAFMDHPKIEVVQISDVADLQSKKPVIVVFVFSFYDDLKRQLGLYQWCRESRAITVLWTGEATVMKPNIYDWSFSAELTSQRNMLAVSSHSQFILMYPDYAKKAGYIDFRNEPKTKFCYFLYSNSHAKERIVFAQKLMQYKKVDCMGEVLNNMPRIFRSEYCQDISILKDLENYKFGIAFENHLREHCTTEKIYRCFLTGSSSHLLG